MLFYIRLVITLLLNTLVIPVFLLYKCYLLPEWIYNKFIKYIIVFNGPVFIKYVQLLLIDKLSLREFISNDLIEELTDLEDNIYKSIKLEKKLVINNQHLNIENNYSIASGTISSVYEFKYKNKDYILKKVHKNIEKNIKYGYILLKLILNNFPFNKKYSNFIQLIDMTNFKTIILKQCDMNFESKILKKFYKLFNTSHIINTPKYIFNTGEILIMEKLSGYKLNQFISLYPKKKLETYCVLMSTIYSMIKYKLLHGDFHFGNMFFNIKNEKVIINIFDYGIVFNLTDKQSEYLLDYIETLDSQNLIYFLKTLNSNIPSDPKIYKKFYSKNISGINIQFLKKYHIPLEIINLLSILRNLKIFFTKNDLNFLLDFMINNNIID
jgi:predicted unusual protein kinase regulating ubiquinone biosynthesis (AarF/ABC1/UbiB family)